MLTQSLNVEVPIAWRTWWHLINRAFDVSVNFRLNRWVLCSAWWSTRFFIHLIWWITKQADIRALRCHSYWWSSIGTKTKLFGENIVSFLRLYRLKFFQNSWYRCILIKWLTLYENCFSSDPTILKTLEIDFLRYWCGLVLHLPLNLTLLTASPHMNVESALSEYLIAMGTALCRLKSCVHIFNVNFYFIYAKNWEYG